eukprot:CAMPEP_0170472994 /NCGR_PEP_ID=MMETSP0123-20130129/14951_1 /TAXON_ID=182087 /ORGANISM="Favella ehrenbergii, Strain Fehren 1" /LENGTH=104 /DNA_ID=CAMNT_0010741673 /DNA_START=60 /DNA_END=374 /DNA_ORIENTATION=-
MTLVGPALLATLQIFQLLALHEQEIGGCDVVYAVRFVSRLRHRRPLLLHLRIRQSLQFAQEVRARDDGACPDAVHHFLIDHELWLRVLSHTQLPYFAWRRDWAS